MPRLLTVALLFAALAVAGRPAPAGAEVAASPGEIHPILLGAEIPDVSVTSLDGEELSLRELVTAQPTVLIFYRGGW